MPLPESTLWGSRHPPHLSPPAHLPFLETGPVLLGCPPVMGPLWDVQRAWLSLRCRGGLSVASDRHRRGFSQVLALWLDYRFQGYPEIHLCVFFS